MAENSAISWTDHTFNPVIGCQKVSPACAHCYAERDFDHRYGKAKWGPNGTRVLTSDANWKKPLKWNADAQAAGVRTRVFCASLSDVFEDWQRPILDSKGNVAYGDTGHGGIVFSTGMTKVRKRLFKLIDDTPNLDWLLLTKRPENIRRMWWAADGGGEGLKPRRNVWLGTSVENQEYAEKRIPELLKCRDLSPVLFLSCEPLLGHVDLRKVRTHEGHRDVLFVGSEGGYEYAGSPRNFINWIIAGGESGPDARPSNPDWFRSLRDQCKAAGVPFHFKQWGEWAGLNDTNADLSAFTKADNHAFDEDTIVYRIGTKKAGRFLDGTLHNDFPFSNH